MNDIDMQYVVMRNENDNDIVNQNDDNNLMQNINMNMNMNMNVSGFMSASQYDDSKNEAVVSNPPYQRFKPHGSNIGINTVQQGPSFIDHELNLKWTRNLESRQKSSDLILHKILKGIPESTKVPRYFHPDMMKNDFFKVVAKLVVLLHQLFLP